MTNQKITNKEAKRLLNNRPVVWVAGSSIDPYTDMTNYYNAGINGWNYSIGYNTRLDKWVICGYRIPNSVLAAASEVEKMSQKEAFLHI
jgi:hypothetical protein